MASTSSAGESQSSPQSPQFPMTPQPVEQSPYDRLTKDELLAIQRYNDTNIRQMFAKNVEVSKSNYLQQVLVEQQQIEARLAMLEQIPEDRSGYLQNLAPLPEYILSVKARAAQRPLVLKGKSKVMSVEEATAIIRRDQRAEASRRPAPTSAEMRRMSEKEKQAAIMDFMSHRDSDDDQDDDDDYSSKDGELDEEMDAVGGEWIDTNDLSSIITVDTERINAGGFYTNYIDDP